MIALIVVAVVTSMLFGVMLKKLIAMRKAASGTDAKAG
jgi:hypothetical protein